MLTPCWVLACYRPVQEHRVRWLLEQGSPALSITCRLLSPAAGKRL